MLKKIVTEKSGMAFKLALEAGTIETTINFLTHPNRDSMFIILTHYYFLVLYYFF